MKTKLTSISGIMALALTMTGCETIQTPDGQSHTVFSREGVAIVNTLTSAGAGAMTGLLMNGAPGVATGSVAGATGSIVQQTTQGLLPTREKKLRDYQNAQMQVTQQTLQR